MTAAATSARSSENTIFSTATRCVGSGASSRSSISLVKEKSMTSGNAVVCSAVRNAVSAMTPGSRTSEYRLGREAELDEHLAEDEQQEDRLQHHLQQERDQLPAGDEHVAPQQRPERAAHAGGRRATAPGSSQLPSGQVEEDVLQARLPDADAGEPGLAARSACPRPGRPARRRRPER